MDFLTNLLLDLFYITSQVTPFTLKTPIFPTLSSALSTLFTTHFSKKGEMLSAFVFLVLVVCNFNGFVESLNGEGYALLSFKQSIYEDPEGSLSNWNSSDENPCSWNGVTCKEQRVISVSIPKNKLYGFLSSSLGSLSDLRHVNLRNNKFFGSLPTELLEVQGLQSLVLYGNSFSGPLSNEIGKLKYLQTLDLSQNLFNGSLPASMVQCKRLKALDLSQNNFTGPLPDGFGTGLVSLEKLDLSFNRFNGSIPSNMGNLSSLQGTVDLSHNLFSGSIPASLGNLPEKVYIDLTYNNLSGPIPQSGALMNRGPTAFIGNPGLCGTPLKNPCSDASSANSPSSYPFFPNNYPPEKPGDDGRKIEKGRGLRFVVVARVRMETVMVLRKERRERKSVFCFRKDESETLSENVEQYDLVPLDTQVAFDLDELLKASAFVLGKSGIGIVYKVVLEDGLTLAVRRLGEGGSQRFKEFQTEVEAIGKLRHPNIVTLRAYYWSVDEKLLIYDYIPNGSLGTALHGNLGSYYLAPEALKVVKPSQKWDIYSYGVILLEMITGRTPVVHVGSSEMDLVHWIQLCIEEKKPLADVLDPYLAPDADREEEIIAVLKIAMACVHCSPERRPTMRHISDALDRLVTCSD
ncbi:hypothetical protein Pint_22088 [Pistacia integerrima]|uniref:Uncharacterized protein n=1 Tax=Pistacia integerrima TaxID=434235 RepID=A0ACC0YKD1_9ROSI|nr:hypothetical protein Pint_22088 [Pistacia integerrima]